MSNKSITPFIREQFPKYILESSSLFPDFLEAYYEWANLTGNFQSVSYDLRDVNNVDLSYSKFLEDFTNEYLDGIPTDVLVNKQLLIKKISELYEAKGTPKAIQFLLRILYNVDSTIFYPSTQVFKASDAKWNRDVSVRFTLDSGSINSTTSQSYATITYNNKTIDVIILKIVSVSGVSGLYEAFLDIKYKLELDESSSPKLTTDDFVGSLVKTTATKNIVSRGKHFLVGDIIDIVGGSGSGTKIKVTKVDSSSGLSGFQIIQFGVNYSSSFVAEIEPTSKSILTEVDTDPSVLNAFVEFSLGYVLEYPGFYSSNVGFPSDASYIHDGEYYQQFSYVVKSEVDGVSYSKPLELIHPSGLKAFSEYVIENSVDINIEIATILNKINSKIQDFIAISDEMYVIVSKPLDEEFITLDDSPSISMTMGAINDSLSFTDSINFGYLIERALSDTFGSSESIAFDFSTNIGTDTFGSSESIAFDFSTNIGTDTFSTTDSVDLIKTSGTDFTENQAFSDSIILGTNQLSVSLSTLPTGTRNLTTNGQLNWHIPSSTDINGGTRKTGGSVSITVTEYDPSNNGAYAALQQSSYITTATDPSTSTDTYPRFYITGTNSELGFYVDIPISIFTRVVRMYMFAYASATPNAIKFYAELLNGSSSPVLIYPSYTSFAQNFYVATVTVSSTSATTLRLWWTGPVVGGNVAQCAYMGTSIGSS